MGDNEANAPQLPKPDPALRRLDRLVGTWTINGRPLGADEDNVSEDGKSFSGGWRPDPGKEGPENVAYDVTGTRVS